MCLVDRNDLRISLLCVVLHTDQQQRQEVSERQRRVTISISMAPPMMPSYPSPRAHRRRQQRERPLTTVNTCRAGDLSYSVISCRWCDDDDSVSVCLGKDRERHRNSDNTNTGKHTPVCHAKLTLHCMETFHFSQINPPLLSFICVFLPSNIPL